MKKFSVAFSLVSMVFSFSAKSQTIANDPLKFNPNMKFTEKTLTYINGKTVRYRAYENIYYVSNVVDSEYQYLNFYVPESSYAGLEQGTGGEGSKKAMTTSANTQIHNPSTQPFHLFHTTRFTATFPG